MTTGDNDDNRDTRPSAAAQPGQLETKVEEQQHVILRIYKEVSEAVAASSLCFLVLPNGACSTVQLNISESVAYMGRTRDTSSVRVPLAA